jgi:hypothetical protein
MAPLPLSDHPGSQEETGIDTDQHDRLIAEAASRLAHCDVVMLAQFSMARARSAVQQVIGNKVLTSPDSAVAKLKAVLHGQ